VKEGAQATLWSDDARYNKKRRKVEGLGFCRRRSDLQPTIVDQRPTVLIVGTRVFDPLEAGERWYDGDPEVERVVGVSCLSM
jgi:hypothetical protein